MLQMGSQEIFKFSLKLGKTLTFTLTFAERKKPGRGEILVKLPNYAVRFIFCFVKMSLGNLLQIKNYNFCKHYLKLSGMSRYYPRIHELKIIIKFDYNEIQPLSSFKYLVGMVKTSSSCWLWFRNQTFLNESLQSRANSFYAICNKCSKIRIKPDFNYTLRL